MIRFISSSETWENSGLPAQTAQGLPAWRSSMGPLRKASAVIALASIAREGSIPCFMAVPLLRSTIAQKCLILVFQLPDRGPMRRQNENLQFGGIGFPWQLASSTSLAMDLIFTMGFPPNTVTSRSLCENTTPIYSGLLRTIYLRTMTGVIWNPR